MVLQASGTDVAAEIHDQHVVALPPDLQADVVTRIGIKAVWHRWLPDPSAQGCTAYKELFVLKRIEDHRNRVWRNPGLACCFRLCKDAALPDQVKDKALVAAPDNDLVGTPHSDRSST